MAIEGLKSYYDVNKKKYQVLTEEQCETLINAAFGIFERTGIKILDPESRELLEKNGCTVEGELVKVPRELAIRCINTAPDVITLYDRLGNKRIEAGGTNTYFGLGPTNPFTNDFETGERRQSVLSDTTRAAIVADACPNIDFLMDLAQVSDVNVDLSDEYSAYELLTNSIKPCLPWAIDKDNMDDIVKMADAIAGGHDKLVEKPFVFLFSGCPVTPLIIDEKNCKMIKYAAQSGLPQLWMGGIQLGTTSPVTIAGAIASNLTEMLSALILAQLYKEGSAIALGMVTLTVDMGTTYSAYGSPEHCLGESINADIFHYLGIPTMQTGGVTDSHIVDEQSAIETSMAVLTNILSGGNMVHDVGFINGAMSGSLDQIVMVDEIISYARRIERGIEINDETLALDVIHEVGPGGEFLTEDHTFENFRDVTWFPTLLNRDIYGNWIKNGYDMRTRIHNKTAKILAEHKAPALSDDTIKTLRDILAAAEKRVGK